MSAIPVELWALIGSYSADVLAPLLLSVRGLHAYMRDHRLLKPLVYRWRRWERFDKAYMAVKRQVLPNGRKHGWRYCKNEDYFRATQYKRGLKHGVDIHEGIVLVYSRGVLIYCYSRQSGGFHFRDALFIPREGRMRQYSEGDIVPLHGCLMRVYRDDDFCGFLNWEAIRTEYYSWEDGGYRFEIKNSPRPIGEEAPELSFYRGCAAFEGVFIFNGADYHIRFEGTQVAFSAAQNTLRFRVAEVSVCGDRIRITGTAGERGWCDRKRMFATDGTSIVRSREGMAYYLGSRVIVNSDGDTFLARAGLSLIWHDRTRAGYSYHKDTDGYRIRIDTGDIYVRIDRYDGRIHDAFIEGSRVKGFVSERFADYTYRYGARIVP